MLNILPEPRPQHIQHPADGKQVPAVFRDCGVLRAGGRDLLGPPPVGLRDNRSERPTMGNNRRADQLGGRVDGGVEAGRPKAG